MNILITSNSAWNILHFRGALVEALLADGHEVTVLAPLDDSVEALGRLGCRFMPLSMDVKGLNPFGAVALWLRLRAIFRSGGHDAILSYTIKNNLFGALAARSCGIPFLPNVTGLGTAFLSGRGVQRVAETLYRVAFSRLPVVFFQNADDMALFVSRGLVREGQARLLPGSGIDLAHFAPAPEPAPDAPPVFLLIARLIRDKGVLEFVEAARRIKAEWPEARFQLLGALAAENRTAIDRDTVRGWADAGLVEYLGTTEDVRPHIAAAHCVVLPSYREGAPRTLIEAAAMARPVIATDVPGCRAVVDADVSGLLCRVRDAESLTEALRRFLAMSPGQQRQMGLAGRAKMERDFDQAIVVNAYRAALDELAGPRKG